MEIEKENESNLEFDENSEEKVDGKHEHQLKWMFVILGGFLVVLFLFFWVGTDVKTFESVGLQWQKESFGDIPIYTTYVTGYSITGKPINFKMPFRTDPRSIDVPIEGNLEIIEEQPIYISIDLGSGINECGTLGLINFGRFMAEMRFELISSVTTEEWAEEIDRPLANCEEIKDNTVFVLTTGNESRIYQDSSNQNCYILEVGQCQDIEVLEKLQLAILAEYTDSQI